MLIWAQWINCSSSRKAHQVCRDKEMFRVRSYKTQSGPWISTISWGKGERTTQSKNMATMKILDPTPGRTLTALKSSNWWIWKEKSRCKAQTPKWTRYNMEGQKSWHSVPRVEDEQRARREWTQFSSNKVQVAQIRIRNRYQTISTNNAGTPPTKGQHKTQSWTHRK